MVRDSRNTSVVDISITEWDPRGARARSPDFLRLLLLEAHCRELLRPEPSVGALPDDLAEVTDRRDRGGRVVGAADRPGELVCADLVGERERIRRVGALLVARELLEVELCKRVKMRFSYMPRPSQRRG